MTTTTDAAPKTPLGVGKIFSKSLRFYFRNFIAITAVAFPLAYAEALLVELLSATLASITFNTEWIELFVGLVLSGAVAVIIGVYVAHMALDEELDQPRSHQAHIISTIKMTPIALICGIIYTFLATLGFALLIIPGFIWLSISYAAFPALAIEGRGIGCFGRSRRLVSGYVWPVLGTVVISLCLAVVISAPLIMFSMFSPNPDASQLVYALSYTVIYGLTSVIAAMVYFRLRDLKEGIGVRNIAEVFS